MTDNLPIMPRLADMSRDAALSTMVASGGTEGCRKQAIVSSALAGLVHHAAVNGPTQAHLDAALSIRVLGMSGDQTDPDALPKAIDGAKRDAGLED